MATIALYASKVNRMVGMINEVKQSVTDYKAELSALNSKSLTINTGVCSMDDVISSIQASTLTQEQKIASLDAIKLGIESFISVVLTIEGIVADVINQRKDDFYREYYYLKPECEKTVWEIIYDGFVSFSDWCKENWKLVAAIALVLLAILAIVVILICTGGAAGPVLAAVLSACKGLITGAVMGGLMGGLSSIAAGGSFLEGLGNGAFSGAIFGAISAGLGQWYTGGTVALGGGGVALSFTQVLKIGVASGVVGSMFSDMGDNVFRGADISLEQMLQNMFISGVEAGVGAAISYGFFKAIDALASKISTWGAGRSVPKAPKPGSLSDVDARIWYLDSEAKIPNLIDKTKPLEQQARQASALRNQFRTQARDAMIDRAGAEQLFGAKPNLTWEQLVEKYTKRGFSGDALYREIIEASQRSDVDVNSALGIYLN